MTISTWMKTENVFSNTDNAIYFLSQHQPNPIFFVAALVMISYDDLFQPASCVSPFAACFIEPPECSSRDGLSCCAELAGCS